jgi:flagellar hook-associated protein 3 FlgL
MRISTSQIFLQGIDTFGEQQVKISKLQQQISTGNRLTKPSDDPAASARVLELDQTVTQALQYQENITLADNRLRLEETTTDGIENVVFRLRELAIQANNASLDSTSRNAIGVEMNERFAEFLSLANTKDANGDFLFAGFQSGTQPFAEATTGAIRHVNYLGDQGQRSLQISQTRQITVDNSGSELFLEIPSLTALNETVANANTGTGNIAPAQVYDASTFVPSNVTITFTSATTYDVTDSATPANNVVGAVYTDGSAIDVGGVRTSITAAPATGDVFTISQGQYKNVFETMQTLVDTINAPTVDQRSANIAGFLTDIDNFFTRVLEVRTSIGGRLNALDSQKDANEANIVVTQSTLATLRDTDMTAAISQLRLEQTTLEAAQAVFARITSSTLFNFLN